MSFIKSKIRRKWLNTTYKGDERRKKKRILFMLLWVVLFSIFFYRFVLSSCIVEGDSMAPTLSVGSYHLVNRAVYFFHPPQRGDIVVLMKKKIFPFLLIKRIVGLPKEKVAISQGKVWINSEKIEEPYISSETTPSMREITLGEFEYFVLGDNRKVAEDSRYWGPVHRKEIFGKVIRY